MVTRLPSKKKILLRLFDRWHRYEYLRARYVELESKYNELLYQVCTKTIGETRHETAKRYIIQAENKVDNVPVMNKDEFNTDLGC